MMMMMFTTISMKAVITMATPCASGAYVHYVTSYSKMIYTTVA